MMPSFLLAILLAIAFALSVIAFGLVIAYFADKLSSFDPNHPGNRRLVNGKWMTAKQIEEEYETYM